MIWLAMIYVTLCCSLAWVTRASHAMHFQATTVNKRTHEPV